MIYIRKIIYKISIKIIYIQYRIKYLHGITQHTRFFLFTIKKFMLWEDGDDLKSSEEGHGV